MPERSGSKLRTRRLLSTFYRRRVARLPITHRLRHCDAEIQSQSWLIVRKFRLYAPILSDRTSTLKFDTYNRATSFLLKVYKSCGRAPVLCKFKTYTSFMRQLRRQQWAIYSAHSLHARQMVRVRKRGVAPSLQQRYSLLLLAFGRETAMGERANGQRGRLPRACWQTAD